MKQDQSDFFLKKLLEIKTSIGDGTKAKKSGKREFSSGSAPDISVETYTKDLRMNLGEQEWQKLKLVEAAIENIENNCYGICEECEEPIPVARLEVIPFATHCVKCLSKLEEEKRKAPQEPLI
jgi:DnaK suppressor protein